MNTVVGTLSAATLGMICLASHGLLAAGALGVLGSLLRSPIMVTAAGIMVAAVVTLMIVHRRGFHRRR